MIKLLAWTNAYLTREEGATAIEYGLIAALISLAIVAGATVFGEQLGALFDRMAGIISGTADAGAPA